MHKFPFIFLVFLCTAAICTAGRTNSSDTPPAAPTTPSVPAGTSATTIAPPVTTQCYWDAQKMACVDHPVTATATVVSGAPAAIPSTTTVGSDPILHRWIRKYPASLSGSPSAGYEFMFYPEGTVVYKEGTIEEKSSNLRIPSPDITGTGTWTKLSDDHYLVKVAPVNSTGTSLAPIVRQYVHVAAYGTLPERLVSDYEQNYVDNATNNGLLHAYSEDVFYVDRVKTD